MLVIGLTGGIGSGKSTVANLFAEKGITIIDADISARELSTVDQPSFKIIIDHFGPEIVNSDGSLNRSALRKIIFKDNKQRLWLEQLLHPLIESHMKAQVDHAVSAYCIAVIPLLLEVEFYSFINRILVVDAPLADQIKRVMMRDKMSQTEIEAVLKTQATREQRLLKANDVILNDGKIQDLEKQVDKLHQKYLSMA